MKFCNTLDDTPLVTDPVASSIVNTVAFSIFPFFGIIFLGIGIRDYLASSGSLYGIINFLSSIVAAIITCICGYCILNQGSAMYSLEPDGIVIKYIFSKNPECISWDMFQQICVCYADISHTRRNTIICCVRHGERKNWNNRWKTDNIFHYRKVIRIAFSEERLAEFAETCPFPVVDLRGIGGYR